MKIIDFLFIKFIKIDILSKKMKKGLIISVIVAVIVIGLTFLLFSPKQNTSENIEIGKETFGEVINQVILDTELKDIATGKNFRISDFSDKPVLLESFAVWCPTCTAQQKVTKKFHEEVGDSVVSISIDTDPNEAESRVLEHIEKNGFNWYYAISPVELTKSLIDQFGVGIVNAPSVPMILICGDKATMLDSGIKSVSELKKEVERCNG